MWSHAYLKSFDVFGLDLEKIDYSVKREIGLIQGHRRRKSADVDWRTLASDMVQYEDQDENEQSTSPGGIISRVVKMKCSAHSSGAGDNNDARDLTSEMERLCSVFCWQFKIPFLPPDRGNYSQEDSGVVPITTMGTKKTPSSKNRGGGGAEEAGTSANANSLPPADTPAAPRRLSRSRGGGKRPPKRPRKSSTDSSFTMAEMTTTSSESEDTTSVARSSISKAPRKKKRKGDRKSQSGVTFLPISSESLAPKKGQPVQQGAAGSSNIRKLIDPRLESNSRGSKKKKDGRRRSSIKKPRTFHGMIRRFRRSSNLISTVDDIRRLTEKDDEWLGYSGSEDEANEVKGKNKRSSRRRNTEATSPELQEFLNATRVLDKVAFALGLFPYSKHIEGNQSIQVTWDPNSVEFVFACVNAFVFFMVTTSSASSLFYITSLKGVISTSHEVLQIDYANHLPVCLFLVFMTLFLSIWSISSIMALGMHYARFMSRLNQGICVLAYDVSEGIHEQIVWTFRLVGVFLPLVVVLFFGGFFKTESVREACGFIGVTILRPYNYEIRESIYYPLVEVFGLIVFLHAFLSLVVVLLQFCVHAKVLENMGRHFNLRLVYRLGQIIERSQDGKTRERIRKAIPVEKLHGEHLIVTSLFQNFGQVNAVVFNAYIFCMALEVMLTMWMLFQVFADFSVSFESAYYKSDKGDGVVLAVPLRLHDHPYEAVMKVVVIFVVNLAGFLSFGGSMHEAADALQIGKEYIRRKGLMLCRTSRERRFILSMMNSFTSKHPYWIGRVFHFNRAFILGFLGFLVGASMVFASFHPTRTTATTAQRCKGSGDCTIFTVPKVNLDVLFASTPVDPSVPSPADNFHASDEYDEHHGDQLKRVTNKLENNSFIHTACRSQGSYPYFMSHSEICRGTWSDPSLPSRILVPHLYKAFELQDQTKANVYDYFRAVVEPFASFPASSPSCYNLSHVRGAVAIQNLAFTTSKCVSSEHSCYYFPFSDDVSAGDGSSKTDIVVLDCFGKPVSSERADDCRNLNIDTPNNDAHRSPAILRLTNSGDLVGVRTNALMCCYQYTGYNDSANQAKVCNMPDADTYDSVCQFGAGRPGMPKVVFKHQAQLFLRVEYEKTVKNNEDYLEKNEGIFKACLCSFENSTLPRDVAEACAIRHLPPCWPDYSTRGEDGYPILECHPKSSVGVKVYVPALFKVNSDFAVGVEHQRYAQHCKGPEFTDSFTHDDSLSYANTYDSSGGSLNLADCAGRKISLGEADRDDCLNWRVPTPDGDWSMTPPTVTLVQVKRDAIQKKLIDFTASTKETMFLCCFHYASPDFQTNVDQLKYCNAPNIEAMNDGKWCQAAVQRGYTSLPSALLSPIPGLHEQLNEKLKQVILYNNIKNPDLDVLTSNDIWMKCLCTKFIKSFTEADYKKSVKECVSMIPKPFELENVGVYEAHPHCSHKWNNLKQKIVMPRVFTIVNGIWESVDFEMAGQKDKCMKDENWQRKYPTDSSVTLYDRSLNEVHGKVDDCGIFPAPTGPVGSEVVPEKRILAEYMLAKYDSSFENSNRAHCCYSFDAYREQWEVCNLPSAQSIRKYCGVNPTPERVSDEKQYVRISRVDKNGAHFVGNKVNLQHSLSSESWYECLCNKEARANCQNLYLPPCITPKTKSNYMDISSTFTKCPSSWGKHNLEFVSVPIIMEYDAVDKTFQPFKRFKDGATLVECPSKTAQDILIAGGGATKTLTDCFGETAQFSFDECKNPSISSPRRSDLTKRVGVKMQLIPLNSNTEFSNDDRFFCCYEYGISTSSEVEVCNMPNPETLESRCSDNGRAGFVKECAEVLKARRVRRPRDVLKQSYNDEERKSWRSCICEGRQDVCRNLVKHPCQFIEESDFDKKMYTICKNTNSHWIYGGTLHYPTILRKFPGTIEFQQIMPLGSDCDILHPPPSSQEVRHAIPPDVGQIHDCFGNEYEYNHNYYTDECENPYFPRKDQNGFWGDDGFAKLIVVIRGDRPYCVFEYKFNGLFSEHTRAQAEFCNMPNQATLDRKCGTTSKRTGTAQEYANKVVEILPQWSSNDRFSFLQLPETFVCLCDFLKLVNSHPRFSEFHERCPSWLQYLEDHR